MRARLYDSTISVFPEGSWAAGLAPNIAIEWWGVYLENSEIYGCTVDNTLSIVNDSDPDSGLPTVRIHDHTILTSAQRGYPLELSNHRVEVDHNYVDCGADSYLAANWGWAQTYSYWSIHHNYVVNRTVSWPNALLHLRRGIEHLNVDNNTFELGHADGKILLYFESDTSFDVRVANNIFKRTVAHNGQWRDRVARVSASQGTVLSDLTVSHNVFYQFPPDLIEDGVWSDAGTTYVPATRSVAANLADTDPLWVGTGAKPLPFYELQSTSPALQAGVDLGYPYNGAAPEIGAWEQ